MTVSHIADRIMDYFGDGSGVSPITGEPFGVSIEYFVEETPLGNTGALFRLKDKMETLLGKEVAYLDGIYFCPHHPLKGYKGERPELKFDCDCQKPKPGMLLKAAEDLTLIWLSLGW